MINLVGSTVVGQRLLSAAELDAEGYEVDDKITALELDDGTVIYAMDFMGGSAGLVGYNLAITPAHNQYFEVRPL